MDKPVLLAALAKQLRVVHQLVQGADDVPNAGSDLVVTVVGPAIPIRLSARLEEPQRVGHDDVLTQSYAQSGIRWQRFLVALLVIDNGQIIGQLGQRVGRGVAMINQRGAVVLKGACQRRGCIVNPVVAGDDGIRVATKRLGRLARGATHIGVPHELPSGTVLGMMMTRKRDPSVNAGVTAICCQPVRATSSTHVPSR